MTVSEGRIVYAPLRLLVHGRLSGPLMLRKGRGEIVGTLPVYSSETKYANTGRTLRSSC